MTVPGAELPLEVLYVEDAEPDAELMREAFSDLELSHRLSIVRNGERALEFLRSAASLPALVVLDLNLPLKSGYEVLQELVADPRLCKLPVAVLTTSARPEDALALAGPMPVHFLTKPLDYLSFLEAVRVIDRLARGDAVEEAAAGDPQQ